MTNRQAAQLPKTEQFAADPGIAPLSLSFTFTFRPARNRHRFPISCRSAGPRRGGDTQCHLETETHR